MQTNLLHLKPKPLAVEAARVQHRVRFEFPRFQSALGRAFGRLLRASPTIKLTLDDVATAAWDLLDGERDVMAVGNALRARYGNDVEPLYERLGALLRILAAHRLIRLENHQTHAGPLK